MKVVQVITRFVSTGGAAQHVLALSRLLKARGLDVTIVSGPPTGREGDAAPLANALGIETRVVPSLQRDIHPVRDTMALFETKSALRRLRPDVVHTHSAKAGVLGRVAAHTISVPAIVHTWHALPFHPGQSALVALAYSSIEQAVSGHAHRYICVGEEVRRRLAALDIVEGARSETIPCGMDPAPWRAAGPRPGKGVVGCVARLAPLKGHDLLIRLAKENPDLEFRFIGDGERRRELVELARGLRVTFVGQVPRERMPEELARCDAVALASEREGVPLVLVEAILAGRPVVAFRLDGAPEIVEEGATGYLAKTPDEFGPSLRKALELSPDRAAVERLTERYDENRMADRVAELYRSLLG